MKTERTTAILKMVIAMTTDCIMGGITLRTYISNLETVIREIKTTEEATNDTN